MVTPGYVLESCVLCWTGTVTHLIALLVAALQVRETLRKLRTFSCTSKRELGRL